MLRRTLLALLVPMLLAAACGGSEKSAATANAACPTSALVDGIKISVAKDGKPTLNFDKPLKVTATSCKVVRKGSGAKVRDGASAVFDYLFINGRDGKEISSSFGQEPAEVIVDTKLMAGVGKALAGMAAGTRVLVAIAPADGFGKEGDPQSGIKATDTLLLYIDLHDVRTPLTRAKGTAVDPVPGLPTVVLAPDGTPTITVPKADPPTTLVTQLLIAGKGAIVKTGQKIKVHYTGVQWSTGEVFDSSWTKGAPVDFSIGTKAVIAGWDKGLVGQRVGSQVLLVVPPADGYPEGSGSIPAGATLVFVVDLLDARD